MRIRILATAAALAACSGLQPQPIQWTPEQVSATQQTFRLPGEWRFTARSGADFGRRCDIAFEADGTYRKSCRPPVEEAGEWEQVGEWDGHTMRVRLSERVNLIEKKPIDTSEVLVVVESPDNAAITLDGEHYERR